jgi:hypothetical protein
MSERETVVREPPFAATWLVRCVWRAYTLPAASSVATAAAHSGTPPEHLRRPSVNAARAAATLPRHASLWPSMSHIFHDSGYLRCAQENYYSHLLGVAKLMERCSDGVRPTEYFHVCSGPPATLFQCIDSHLGVDRRQRFSHHSLG